MIWVCGKNGMLGKEMCLELARTGIPFVSSGREIDITSYEVVCNFASINKPKWIINCAAYTAVDKAETEENLAKSINADGPWNLARVATRFGAVLIHFSTDYVFDGQNSNPYKENYRPNPLSSYGRTKFLGEKLVQEATNRFFIFRISWLYGKWGSNFVKTICRLLKEKSELKVVADQYGAPTSALSLAENILEMISSENNSKFGIYHYSDEGRITWYDFALEIKKLAMEFGILDNDIPIIPITTREYPLPAKRPLNSVFEKSKVKEYLLFQCHDWRINLRGYFKEIIQGF